MHHAILFAKLAKTCLVLIAILLAAPSLERSAFAQVREIRDKAMFDRWAVGHATAINAYQSYLDAKGVGSVVPMSQLLRTASDWDTPGCRRIGAQPFEVPPRVQWDLMVKTLKLIDHLRREGLLPEFEVASAYRNPAVNSCAGSKGSRHPRNAALDLIPIGVSPNAAIAKLCGFYRKSGEPWSMGLSLYATGRIHVDADGYRTWGDNGRSDTSACLVKKQPK